MAINPILNSFEIFTMIILVRIESLAEYLPGEPDIDTLTVIAAQS